MTYGLIIYPVVFNRKFTYPVLEFIYTGLQRFITPKECTDLSDFRKLPDEGSFIIVMSDGMGATSVFPMCVTKIIETAGFPIVCLDYQLLR